MKKLTAALLLIALSTGRVYGATKTIQKPASDTLPSGYTSLMIDGSMIFLNQGAQDPIFHSWNNLSYRQSIIQHQYLTQHITIGFGLGMSNSNHVLAENKLLSLNQGGKGAKTEKEVTNKVFPNKKISYTTLHSSYLDIILEGKIHADVQHPKDSFFLVLGASFSPMRWNSQQHVQFSNGDQQINKEPFNLRNIRFGLHARAGWNRLNVFYATTLTSMFNENGPINSKLITPHNVGISIDLF